MPRPRKEYVRLTGRVIAGGGSTTEEVEFVKNKLRIMDQATLVRQAISIYYKYETGQLFEKILEQKLDGIIAKILSNFKGMNLNEFNEMFSNEEAPSNENGLDKLSEKEKEFMNKMKRDFITGFGMLKDE